MRRETGSTTTRMLLLPDQGGARVLTGYAIFVAIILLGAAIGVFGGPVALIVGGTLVVCMTVLWNYRIGVILATLMLPFSATGIFPRGMFGITGMNPLNAVLLVTVFAFFVTWLFDRDDKKIPRFPPLFWYFVLPISLAALHGTLYVHMIPSYYRELDVIQYDAPGGYLRDAFFKPMILVAVAMLVAVVARNSRNPGALLIPLFLSAAILEVVVIGSVAISGLSLDMLAAGRHKGFVNWVGLHANEQGILFNMALALAVFTFFAIRWSVVRLLLAVVIPLTAVAVVLTFSRGAFLGFLVTVFYFFLTRKGVKWLLAGFVFVAMAAILMPHAVIHRAATGFAADDMDRISSGRTDLIWAPIAPTIAEKPLFGHGLDSTLWSVPARKGIIPPVGHPHSAYLRLLLDLGVVGAIFLAIFYHRLWRLFRQLKERQEQPLWKGFFEGASVCIIILAVQGMTDDAFTPTFSQSFMWVAVGLAIGLAQRTQFSAGAVPQGPAENPVTSEPIEPIRLGEGHQPTLAGRKSP